MHSVNWKRVHAIETVKRSHDTMPCLTWRVVVMSRVWIIVILPMRKLQAAVCAQNLVRSKSVGCKEKAAFGHSLGVETNMPRVGPRRRKSLKTSLDMPELVNTIAEGLLDDRSNRIA